MKWSYWIELYIRTHCVARGLRPLTIAAYEKTLQQFRDWARIKWHDNEPDQITARDVLTYVQYLREVRDNGDSAINRSVVVLRRFYAAMVAMGQLDHNDNPLATFPSIKAVPRKLPVALSTEQMTRLLSEPKPDTLLGLRDRALLALLYGTGIRASECAWLRNGNVDLEQLTITVQGKGGCERTIPLNPELVAVLRTYIEARGPALHNAPFFRSRFGKPLSRGGVYERVRTWGQRSRISIPLSPHRIRHYAESRNMPNLNAMAPREAHFHSRIRHSLEGLRDRFAGTREKPMTMPLRLPAKEDHTGLDCRQSRFCKSSRGMPTMPNGPE